MTEVENSPVKVFSGSLETKSVLVYWLPWWGKTLTSWLLTCWYKRIYSNTDFYRYGKQINKKVTSMSQIKRLKFSETPWILVIDEVWINANSRNSQSDGNKLFGELSFIARKHNLYLVWIAQRLMSFDINQRDLSNLILHCKSVPRGKKHPLIHVTRERDLWRGNTQFDAEWLIDIISIQKAFWATYNQLDQSRIKQ